MVEVWFALLCFTLAGFVVLDGSNIGVGVVQPWLARNDTERRALSNALGPLWSWHEVWLLGVGGVLFVAFPSALAVAFSGYYLALFLVLWGLIVRGVALEVGAHLPGALWRSFFDTLFAAASWLLAIALGAAIGNVVRGVPLDARGTFSLAFFTTFRTTGEVGLIDWYTLSTAAFATVALAAHGATLLWLRLDDAALNARARRNGRHAWLAAAALFIVVTAGTLAVRPEVLSTLVRRPAGSLLVAVACAGATAVFLGYRRGRPGVALAGSAAVLGGLVTSVGAALYPELLHSTVSSQHSLTAHAASSSAHGLATALVWWPMALVLSLGYFVVLSKQLRAKA